MREVKIWYATKYQLEDKYGGLRSADETIEAEEVEWEEEAITLTTAGDGAVIIPLRWVLKVEIGLPVGVADDVDDEESEESEESEEEDE